MLRYFEILFNSGPYDFVCHGGTHAITMITFLGKRFIFSFCPTLKF